MRILLCCLGLVFGLSFVSAEPTADQWSVVKKYDGQTFSVAGLKKLTAQPNGWTQYQWTEGRSLWENQEKNWIAVQEPDGTQVYRYGPTEYVYQFPDGRVIKSDPKTAVRTWSPMAGDPSPGFDLVTLGSGAKVSLSSLRGQVVLLDFWASWCGPCQSALPGTEALYQKFKSKGLRVLGINIEGDKAKALANAAELKLTFPTLMAAPGADGGYNWQSAQVADFQITGIPHSILIDKKGVIRSRDTVLSDDTLIQKLLGE